MQQKKFIKPICYSKELEEMQGEENPTVCMKLVRPITYKNEQGDELKNPLQYFDFFSPESVKKIQEERQEIRNHLQLGNRENTIIPNSESVITACKNNFEFFEGESTTCTHKGQEIFLFDGKIKILKKNVLIDDIFDEYGNFLKRDMELFFVVQLVLDDLCVQDNVALREIYSGNFIQKISGGCSCLEEGAVEKRCYRKLIQRKIRKKNFEVCVIYKTPGWKKIDANDRWMYVLPIGVVGNRELGWHSANDKNFYINQELLGTEELIRRFLKMREIFITNKEFPVICQYFLLTALLNRLMKERRISMDFVLAIIGETNSKKTTLAQLFFKLYNRDTNVDIDFQSTKGAIEEALAKNADAVTIFDDIVPPDDISECRAAGEKIEMLLRAYGGTVARKRSSNYVAANPGATEFSPILSAGVITGEMLPVKKKSSRSRILKLELKKTDIDLQKLTIEQQRMETLPTFVVDFLTFVSKNQKFIVDEIEKKYKMFRSQNPCRLKTPRCISACALLFSMTDVFGEYLNSKNIFNMQSVSVLVEEDKKKIQKVIFENDLEIDSRSEEVLIAEAIFEEIKRQTYLEDSFLTPLQKIYVEENTISIYPKTLEQICKSYFQNCRKLFYFSSSRELSELLKSKGLIKTKQEGEIMRCTHKINAGEKKLGHRFFVFYKDKILKLVSEV